MSEQPVPLMPSSGSPDIEVDVRSVFGIDLDLKVPAFSERSEHVPPVDEAYRFDRDTTLAILAGFAYNRRVMIQGYHGTGKSTHVEQVAARLNWPCIRVKRIATSAESTWWAKTPSCFVKVCRLQSSRKVSCLGLIRLLPLSYSTSTMQAGRT